MRRGDRRLSTSSARIANLRIRGLDEAQLLHYRLHDLLLLLGADAARKAQLGGHQERLAYRQTVQQDVVLYVTWQVVQDSGLLLPPFIAL